MHFIYAHLASIPVAVLLAYLLVWMAPHENV